MSALLSGVSSVVSAITSTIGSFVTAITSNTLILLFVVVIPVVGLGVAFLRKLFKARKG